jgi:hypothetical protein
VRYCGLRFLIVNAIPARHVGMRMVMRSKDSRLVPKVLEMARDAVYLCEPRASGDLRACRDLVFFSLGFPCCSVVPGKGVCW